LRSAVFFASSVIVDPVPASVSLWIMGTKAVAQSKQVLESDGVTVNKDSKGFARFQNKKERQED
jgi:hypothetical protein